MWQTHLFRILGEVTDHFLSCSLVIQSKHFSHSFPICLFDCCLFFNQKINILFPLKMLTSCSNSNTTQKKNISGGKFYNCMWENNYCNTSFQWKRWIPMAIKSNYWSMRHILVTWATPMHSLYHIIGDIFVQHKNIIRIKCLIKSVTGKVPNCIQTDDHLCHISHMQLVICSITAVHIAQF